MTTLTAVDAGFSTTKAMATNGRQSVFPSVVGTAIQESGFSLERRSRMTIELDGEIYPVGETALRQSDQATGRRDSAWVTSTTWKVLFYAALSELHRSTVETKVVTGLPLEDWHSLAAILRNRVIGQHTFRRNGNNWQTVTVTDCLVVTQPFGSLLDQAMGDTGAILNNAFSTGMVAVADIGGLTLDMLTTDALEEVGRWTVGDDLGLLKALDKVSRDIRRAFPRFNPKAHEVAGWIADGYFTYGGERYDVKTYADRHLDPLVDMILNRLTEAWPEPGRYAAVLLTGGGASALGSRIKERMNGYQNVVIAQDARMANVRGYLKLARDTWA